MPLALWRMRRVALLGLLPILLAACGGPAQPVWAPDEVVKSAAYKSGGPPMLTLFTVINRQSGSGGHSALMISGEERILFDPAGSFAVSFVPERNDVLFGMSERALAVYIDYHARQTWDVRIQEVEVTLAQARAAAQLAKSYGAVPQAQCALSITRILAQVPGFEGVGVTYFPKALAADIAAFPGATDRLVTDDEADKNHNVLIEASLVGG